MFLNDKAVMQAQIYRLEVSEMMQQVQLLQMFAKLTLLLQLLTVLGSKDESTLSCMYTGTRACLMFCSCARRWTSPV